MGRKAPGGLRSYQEESGKTPSADAHVHKSGKGKALRLYISAAEEAIGAFLVQENEHGNEQAGY